MIGIEPRLPLLAEPWPPGSHPWRPCPVCGENWRPWAFSRLPCHARCFYSPEAQDRLLAILESDRAPRAMERLADRLGVTRATLAAAAFFAAQRRSDPVRVPGSR